MIKGQFKQRLLLAGIVVGLFFVALVIGRTWLPSTPKPLHLNIIEDASSYRFKLANKQLDIMLKALVSGDNGPASIHIYVDGVEQAVLESYFDYDLWQNEAPASYEWFFFDDDRHKDMRLHLHVLAGDSYIISSKEGRVIKQ